MATAHKVFTKFNQPKEKETMATPTPTPHKVLMNHIRSNNLEDLARFIEEAEATVNLNANNNEAIRVAAELGHAGAVGLLLDASNTDGTYRVKSRSPTQPFDSTGSYRRPHRDSESIVASS